MKNIRKILATFLILSLFFANPNKAGAQKGPKSNCSVLVWQQRDEDQCYAGETGCLENLTKTYVKLENLIVQGASYNGDLWITVGANVPYYELDGERTFSDDYRKRVTVSNGVSSRASFDYLYIPSGSNFQSWEIYVKTSFNTMTMTKCDSSIQIESSCSGANSCLKEPTDIAGNIDLVPFEICNQISDSDQKEECNSCLDGSKFNLSDDENDIYGLWTAVGCIPTKPESIVKTFIKLGLSIGGGVTLLLILAGAFQLSISQGDPKKTDDAKQQITAAITGLVFIILSIAILQFIGVSLFQIPGFGT